MKNTISKSLVWTSVLSLLVGLLFVGVVRADPVEASRTELTVVMLSSAAASSNCAHMDSATDLGPNEVWSFSICEGDVCHFGGVWNNLGRRGDRRIDFESYNPISSTRPLVRNYRCSWTPPEIPALYYRGACVALLDSFRVDYCLAGETILRWNSNVFPFGFTFSEVCSAQSGCKPWWRH